MRVVVTTIAAVVTLVALMSESSAGYVFKVRVEGIREASASPTVCDGTSAELKWNAPANNVRDVSVGGSVVYAGAASYASGAVYALSKAGDVRWAETTSDGVYRLVVGAGDSVYVPSSATGDAAHLGADQQRLASFADSDLFDAVAATSSGRVFLGGANTQIHVFEPNGTLISSTAGFSGTNDLAAADGGGVFVASANGLARLDDQGTVVWSRNGAAEDVAYYPGSDEVAFAGRGFILTVDANTGAVLHFFNLDFSHAPAVAVDGLGYLYAVNRDEALVKMTAAGSPVWSVPAATSGVQSLDVDANGDVYVADTLAYRVSAFRQTGCREAAQ